MHSLGRIGRRSIFTEMAKIEHNLGERRWRRELKRREIKQERRRLRAHRLHASAKGYRSPILDLFLKDAGDLPPRSKLPSRTFLAPAIFSISRNPGKCIEFFREIVRYSRAARRPRLVLDQRRITYLGLGADSVLGILLSEIKLEIRHIYGTYIKGFKPKSKEIQRVMDEVGSVRTLFMEAEEEIRLSFSSRANVFRHRHRQYYEAESTTSNDPTANVISDFADHLDGSLSIIGKQLSAEGRDQLCHYAAEVLDNVREHSGMVEWAMVGYSDPDAIAPVYRCVIFCFGKTFAETFQELPQGSYPLDIIAPYVETHRAGSLFGEEWREEDLITLIALQGDVSSKSSDQTSDRGQGTVELISFFQEVAIGRQLRSVPAEMNVITGSTRVRFDGAYMMTFRPDLNRDIIAFNSTNDLMLKPDPKAVIAMGESRFPGTLITVQIPLSSSFLEELEIAYEN